MQRHSFFDGAGQSLLPLEFSLPMLLAVLAGFPNGLCEIFIQLHAETRI
jgi:hypothetical protein